ncbi:MAG TPA: acetate--CoA ligase family protein [Longimicrobiales bacterium]|nr:acetate--CoA ligase family protein [Longimicrobiales bacterium]
MSAGGDGIRDLLRELAEGGAEHLVEDRGLALARAVGLDAPWHRVLAGSGEAESDPGLLEEFPGQKIVVKVLSPRIPHRTEMGGVAVIRRDPWTLSRQLNEWEARFAWAEPRFLVAEYVSEAPGGCELLLGYRNTAEFGPVVTVAPGGIQAEALSGALRPEEGPVMVAPDSLQGAGRQVLARILERRAFLAPVVRGVRGRPPLLGMAGFLDLLEGMATLATQGVAAGLAEFEVNPVRIMPGKALALDALGRFGAPAPQVPGARRSLDHLFHPRTLAVAGVSTRGMNPGRVILRNVLAAGFPASGLQVVKADAAEVDGVRCVPTVEALDPPVDLLVLGVPAPRVPEMVEEAVAHRRARGFILISGGLEEGFVPGEPTPADRVREALREAPAPGPAPVAVGSNCLGIRSVPGRYDTLFIPDWKLGFPARPPAPVALISQSGAFAIARASGMATVNPRYVVTLGTQLDVTVGEVLEHLLDDPELRTAACYVEGFRPGDGARFLAAARAWRQAGRRVLLYRAGRSGAGRDAAASHTASLAGEYAVTRELARGAGVAVAHTVEEFQDHLLLAALLEGRSPGRRLGLLSNAGFECVSLADHAGSLGLADFAPETVDGVSEVLGRSGLDGIVAARNPLDVTPILGDDGFVDAARLVLADPGVEAAVVSCVPLTPALQTLPPGAGHPEDLHRHGALVDGLSKLWRETEKPWVAAVDAGPAYDPLRAALLGSGIPVFPTADRAVRALGSWVEGV